MKYLLSSKGKQVAVKSGPNTMTHTNLDLQRDIERVSQIPIVSTLLDVICQTTGMGFAAVARVTQDRWIACHVRDDIQFGLAAGGELKVETTICNEIRDSHQAVIIDHVQISEQYCSHHTVLQYGFQSYISFPIILKNGEFFGTLCAIDPKPAQLNNPNIIGLFTAFAELISFHLQQIELLEESQLTITKQILARKGIEERESRYRNLSDELELLVQKRTQELQESVHDLQRSNQNLEQFAYIASHDLQEPLRKIQGFGDLLKSQYGDQLGEGIDFLNRMQSAASRMSTLIYDLLTFSRITIQPDANCPVALAAVVDKVLTDLELVIEETGAQIHVGAMPTVLGNAAQLNQLFQNLLSNALKFRRDDTPPVIEINTLTIEAAELSPDLKPTRLAKQYYLVNVRDNGVCFDE
ncbi:MAG: histidine kinase, partial [Spirosoma sp.]|nr:histidine kinase [Spirosoma sp.]